MDARRLAALPHTPPVPLAPPTLDATAVSIALEAALRSAIAEHRAGLRDALAIVRGARMGACGSSPAGDDSDAAATRWDARLSYLLQPALAAYEMVRDVRAWLTVPCVADLAVWRVHSGAHARPHPHTSPPPMRPHDALML
jgi:hypothetical protein